MRAADSLEFGLFGGRKETKVIKQCSFLAWNAITKVRRKIDYVSWQTSTGNNLKCEHHCGRTNNEDRERQEKAWKKCISDYSETRIPRHRSLPYEKLEAEFEL